MRGRIEPRGNGFRITVRKGKNSETGKYERYTEQFYGSSKEAEKRLTQLLSDNDKGKLIIPGKATLADYLKQWLRGYAFPNLSPRTAEGYEGIIDNHLIPSLGKLPMSQIRPERIQKYYAEKTAGGLSSTTVRHHHMALHGALKQAVKMGMLIVNPADAVTAPRPAHHEMKTMNEKDIHIFLEFAKADMYSLYYALFYTLLFTGLRRSEALALRWQDADLLLCQIYVNRSLHQLKGGGIVFRQPKTERSRRMISLTASNAIVLREHYEKQKAQRQALGLPIQREDDLVFCQWDGKPLLPNTVSHVWEKLTIRTGLKGIRLHDARHTHASLMLKQGIHPKVVQERLGHSSITTTLDTYSHVAPGLQAAAAAKFDDIVLPREKAADKVS
jgi:integrase